MAPNYAKKESVSSGGDSYNKGETNGERSPPPRIQGGTS